MTNKNENMPLTRYLGSDKASDNTFEKESDSEKSISEASLCEKENRKVNRLWETLELENKLHQKVKEK